MTWRRRSAGPCRAVAGPRRKAVPHDGMSCAGASPASRQWSNSSHHPKADAALRAADRSDATSRILSWTPFPGTGWRLCYSRRAPEPQQASRPVRATSITPALHGRLIVPSEEYPPQSSPTAVKERSPARGSLRPQTRSERASQLRRASVPLEYGVDPTEQSCHQPSFGAHRTATGRGAARRRTLWSYGCNRLSLPKWGGKLLRRPGEVAVGTEVRRRQCKPR